jgi:hypothetical protein
MNKYMQRCYKRFKRNMKFSPKIGFEVSNKVEDRIYDSVIRYDSPFHRTMVM